jgi:hypothetical protein
MIIWLLQRELLVQLHTYMFYVGEEHDERLRVYMAGDAAVKSFPNEGESKQSSSEADSALFLDSLSLHSSPTPTVISTTTAIASPLTLAHISSASSASAEHPKSEFGSGDLPTATECTQLFEK